MKNVSFLGLGAMGSRMAKRLSESKDLTLTVWNRSPAATQAFKDAGVRVVATPAEAARNADIVISMLTDDAAARSVWLGTDAEPNTGALAAMRPGAIAIEASTVSPRWIQTFYEAAKKLDVDVIDAPVAGSRPQAEAGQLIFMLGGNPKAIEQVLDVLNLMATAVHVVGNSGQGAILKLAVNSLFAAQLQSVAELLGFLSKNGIATKRAAELLAQFPVTSAPAAGAAKLMASRGNVQLFTIDLLEKDLGYAQDAGSAVGCELPGVTRTRETFAKAQQRGWGAENFSAIAKLFD